VEVFAALSFAPFLRSPLPTSFTHALLHPLTDTTVEPLDCAALLQFLQDDHPFSVSTSDTTYEILALLRVINQFNLNWPTLYHKVRWEWEMMMRDGDDERW
jgi:hypothetical protein